MRGTGSCDSAHSAGELQLAAGELATATAAALNHTLRLGLGELPALVSRPGAEARRTSMPKRQWSGGATLRPGVRGSSRECQAAQRRNSREGTTPHPRSGVPGGATPASEMMFSIIYFHIRFKLK